MGEASRRKGEIHLLKMHGPKPKKRRKLLLVDVGEQVVSHYMNAAARAKSGSTQRVYVKVKTWRDVEDPPYVPKAWNAGGFMQVTEPVRSKRSLQKEKNKQVTKTEMVLDRLLRQWPERAAEARDNERMANWFVAACEELIDGNVNREQLLLLVKDGKLGRVDLKYQHAAARRRATEALREAA